MRISPIPLAITMVAGVLMTSQFGITVAGIVTLIILAVFFVFGIITHKFDMGILSIAIIFAISAISYTISVSSISHKSITYINRYVTITGTIISNAEKSQSSDSYRYVFRIKTINDNYSSSKSNEDILLTTPEKYTCGTSLKLKGIIKNLPKQMNESGFDTALYYKSNNIFTRIHSENITKIDKISVFSFRAVGGYITEKVDNIIYNNYEGDGAGILSAVLIGNKHNFSKEYKSLVNSTGYNRILHPAHIHIWIILSVIAIFSKFIRKQHRDIFAAAVFVVYAIFQCSNIGFTRCLVCAAITIYYRLRYGKAFFPDTISVMLIFCCVTMPTILFNNAFILSVAGGLAGWAFIPYFNRRLRKIPRYIRRTASAMLVFAIVLSPISAYFYSGLCIYSFITPFITAPLIVGIIFFAPLSFIIDAVFGSAPIVGAYLNFCVKILYMIPYAIAKLPFSSIYIAKPSFVFELMFLCVVFAAYYKIKKRNNYVFVFTAAASGFFAVIALSAIMNIGTAKFMFVNVGQGDGAIIHIPYKETIVIDAGGSSEYSDYNTGEALFVPYLASKGINHIEAVIVSHYHKDHAEGVINVINSIKTDYVFMPQITEADSDSMIELSGNIKIAAKNRGTKVCFINENTRLEFKSGLTIDIFSPNENLRKSDANNTSLPVKAQYGNFSALYTGDMTAKAEKKLMSEIDVNADILKIAHHGSRDSSDSEFINAVSPDISVISCGENNVYNHPHSEVLDRLSAVTVLRTDLSGDIRISVRKNGKYTVR